AGNSAFTGANQIAAINVPLLNPVPGLFTPGVGGSFTLTNSGALSITNLFAGGTVTVNNGGALTLGASTQDAGVSSFGGQSITADSFHLLAQNGHRATINNTSGDQSIRATAGGIDLIAVNASGVAQIANNRGSLTNGTQSVSATGALNV